MDRTARDLLSRHTSNRACFAQREGDKPRLALNNITAGVREREDANRTREAGHLEEIQGVVANTLNLFLNGAACRVSSFTLVGFIDWLDGLRAVTQDRLRSFGERIGDSEDAAEVN
jgi:hypothetical protein